ncbi:MAG: alkaline phosphatase D family protein [Balneolaceae bacterium]|nr:alkaline phosphatase D family protein [Balneolaceae bacterium]
MDRRESLKTILFGSVSLPFYNRLNNTNNYRREANQKKVTFQSGWKEWPDMEWVGPGFWGNRLQDWQLRDGKVQCAVSAPNRTLHILTHQITGNPSKLDLQVDVKLLSQSGSASDKIGMRLGAKAADDPVSVEFNDYRRDAIFGEGLDLGVQADGRLFIGNKTGDQPIDLSTSIQLAVSLEPFEDKHLLTISALHPNNGTVLSELSSEIEAEILIGGLALLSDFQSETSASDSPSVRFSNWSISGNPLKSDPNQKFGPICFAQYTLNRGILKMTAQLAPVESIKDHSVELQVHRNGDWNTIQTTTVEPLSRTALFRQENWKSDDDIPYRIRLVLPLMNDTREFFYEGTIAAEPIHSNKLKTAVFSCNSHYGFPNKEVVDNVKKHQPDMAVFLGDQLYESHGGFGVQHAPLEKAALDWLRKWYMFGWSYRDIFRHIPSAFIADDHDVYHGNIWGQGGKDAPVEKGWNYNSQDEGGYKMPPEWVNMVQRAQAGNLPDPYDPTPVDQDISVYYTDWTYGGVSFAILEDRKFKTAPKNVLPEEAEVVNGFIQNHNFDIKEYYDIEANLLGDRQLTFLEHWSADWSHHAQMKAVFSQTNFCTVATLPEGSVIDEIVPRLPIPRKGEYVTGDAPTVDMDSNGWPQKGRDEALRRIRKGFALHIAGDQHLASTVQYGIDEHGDAGFAFAGPALNNIWPRRWWPQVNTDHKPLPGRRKNTGDFEDGFGNKMTVYAVGNPVQTNRKPGLIYDRATGYGMIVFDKNERTMRIECWPRYVNPEMDPEGQFDGWPITIKQDENYGRKGKGFLPELRIEGITNPVIQVYNETSSELEYSLRIQGKTFTPKIFDNQSTYRLRVGEPDRNLWQEFENISVDDNEPILCSF